MNGDLVLVPEVLARRALRGQRVRLQVLIPHGSWMGLGALRVLRMKISEPNDNEVQLTVGYDSYQPLSTRTERAKV